MHRANLAHYAPDDILWCFRCGSIEHISYCASKAWWTHTKLWGSSVRHCWRGVCDRSMRRCIIMQPVGLEHERPSRKLMALLKEHLIKRFMYTVAGKQHG